MSKLYIVATPIGNLKDITLRALEALKSVTLIAAEDTRRTLKLLNHFEIKTKLLSCRAQNEAKSAEKILSALANGDDVAYVSDAGTPALSDPGALLVKKAAEAGFDVVPVPGPSAFSTLISVTGASGNSCMIDKGVIFEGFLPVKSGKRKSRLKELLESGFAFVLFESPFRIIKLFSLLAEFDGSRYACIGREMTKIHEEYLRGTVKDLYALLLEKEQKGETRGEFSIYVSGAAV